MIKNLLQKLTISHDSITNTSEQLLLLGQQSNENINDICDQWNQNMLEMIEQQKKDKQLAGIYLINDILQKCKIKNVQLFLELIKQYLLNIFTQLQNNNDQNFQKNIQNLIKVWKQRQLYDDQFLDQLNSKCNSDKIPEHIVNIPKELITYALNIQDLEKWKAKSQQQKQKIKDKISLKHEVEEINIEMKEFRRILDLQQKYQANCLRSLIECIKKIDQNHLNNVLILKNLHQKLEQIKI